MGCQGMFGERPYRRHQINYERRTVSPMPVRPCTAPCLQKANEPCSSITPKKTLLIHKIARQVIKRSFFLKK